MATYKNVASFDEGEPITSTKLNQIVENIDAVREESPEIKFIPYNRSARSENLKIASGAWFAGSGAYGNRTLYVENFFTPSAKPNGLVTISAKERGFYSTSISRTDRKSRVLDSSGMWLNYREEKGNNFKCNFNWIMIGY